MKYQQRVYLWAVECFGGQVAADRQQANHRFLEEGLELVQANGITREECLQLVEYVYGRPIGDPAQEVGGVMVTLARLCEACDLDMDGAALRELQRITEPRVMEKIRAKQAAKPKHSPLRGPSELRGMNASHALVDDPHEFRDAFEKIDT
jgi:hypothetical protein